MDFPIPTQTDKSHDSSCTCIAHTTNNSKNKICGDFYPLTTENADPKVQLQAATKNA
jgi:hypothetical protein